MDRKGFAPLIIIGIVALIIIAGAIGYSVWKSSGMPQQQAKNLELPTSTDVAMASSTTRGIAASASTTDWKTYTSEKYQYQITYPSNWPIVLSGNALTIGNVGTAYQACYIIITFDASNGSGTLIAAPHTYNNFAQVEDEQTCEATLSEIAASGRFASQNFYWPSSYQVDVKTIYVNSTTQQATTNAWFKYSVDGLKARNDDLQNTSTITIFRLDQGKIYTLETIGKVYNVSAVPSSTTQVTPPFDTSGIWQNQGSEVVSQMPANKYSVYTNGVPSDNGNQIVAPSFYVWLDAINGSPLQVQFPSGITEYFSNYSTAPIPASEFEIPAGYTNFNNAPQAP